MAQHIPGGSGVQGCSWGSDRGGGFEVGSAGGQAEGADRAAAPIMRSCVERQSKALMEVSRVKVRSRSYDCGLYLKGLPISCALVARTRCVSTHANAT
eukprot:4635005-Pyramimonas_sp.AAC.1